MPLIDWKPQFVAGQKRFYQDLTSNQPSYSNLLRPNHLSQPPQPFQKTFKLLAVDRSTSLLTSRIFTIFKDSDIAATQDDLAILDKYLIEAGQDDDVDTDDEIMENALNSCYTDLYTSEKRITKYDGSLMLSSLRNYSIFNRTNRPDYYDRNGIYREPNFEDRAYKRAGKMSPIILDCIESKNSCATVVGSFDPPKR